MSRFPTFNGWTCKVCGAPRGNGKYALCAEHQRQRDRAKEQRKFQKRRARRADERAHVRAQSNAALNRLTGRLTVHWVWEAPRLLPQASEITSAWIEGALVEVGRLYDSLGLSLALDLNADGGAMLTRLAGAMDTVRRLLTQVRDTGEYWTPDQAVVLDLTAALAEQLASARRFWLACQYPDRTERLEREAPGCLICGGATEPGEARCDRHRLERTILAYHRRKRRIGRRTRRYAVGALRDLGWRECRGCHHPKPLAEFPQVATRHLWTCKACHKVTLRKRELAKHFSTLR